MEGTNNYQEYNHNFMGTSQNDDNMESNSNTLSGISEKKLEQALFEITDGQHSTDCISYVKSYTKQLIKNQEFAEAYNVLHKLLEARQANTTTILWIGSYLKDIFFNEKATETAKKFDKMALEEMLFYYLKACKLFDPGYKKVKDAVKELEEEN